jgi:hypothetical protein
MNCSQTTNRPGRARRAGFMQIDLMIGLTLLSMILGALATASRSGTSLFQSGMVRSQLEIQTTRTLGKIRRQMFVSELASIAGVPQAPFWDDELVFDQPDDFSSDVGMLGTKSTRIEFGYEDGELDDGIDNDSDGMIDEGVVILTRDVGGPEEQAVVLCRDVRELLEGEIQNGLDDNGNGLIDEKGLSFDINGQNLTVRLTLEGRDRIGNVITRTLVTSIWLRN